MRLNMKILGSLMEAFTSQSMNTIKTGLIWVLRAGWMAGTLPILVASLPSSRLKSFHKLLLGFSRRGKILPSSSQVRTQFSFTIFSTNKKPFFSSFFKQFFFCDVEVHSSPEFLPTLLFGGCGLDYNIVNGNLVLCIQSCSFEC